MIYYLYRVLRFVVLGLDLALLTLVLYLLAWLPHAWTRRFYPRLFWFWSRVFVRALGIELHLHQHQTRRLPEPYLLIANHPSAAEDLVIPALFPVYCLAKIEVRDWWIVGRMSAAAGTLYVHRESKESRRAAKQLIVDELRAGKNIGLYPEGGCKGRRLYHRFYYGVFEISIESGVPIVPVFLHYEAQEDFEWQPPYSLLHKLWHFMTSRNPRAHVHVYDAVEPTGFADKEQFCEYVYGLYRQWQSQYLE